MIYFGTNYCETPMDVTVQVQLCTICTFWDSVFVICLSGRVLECVVFFCRCSMCVRKLVSVHGGRLGWIWDWAHRYLSPLPRSSCAPNHRHQIREEGHRLFTIGRLQRRCSLTDVKHQRLHRIKSSQCVQFVRARSFLRTASNFPLHCACSWNTFVEKGLVSSTSIKTIPKICL